MPARARERLATWYDERNVVHFGGKPAFVLGLYTTSGYSMDRKAYATGDDGWGNDRIAEAPINLLINYHLGRAPIPRSTVYLDDLHARGIRYLQTVNFYHREDGQYREIEYPAARQGEDELNRWVADTLGRHPGLAGFYVADERPAEMVPDRLPAAARAGVRRARHRDLRRARRRLGESGAAMARRARRDGARPVSDRQAVGTEPSGDGRGVDAPGPGRGEGEPAGVDGHPVLPDRLRREAGPPRPSCAPCPGWRSSRARAA